MRKHYNYFQNHKLATEWLSSYLHNHPYTLSPYILRSTKLTDSIYESLSYEDKYYGTQRQQYPINIETLAKDIFGALYSPQIRRNSQEKVSLRELIFNAPVLNNVFDNNSFDILKKFCENNELVSYEAAYCFAKKLSELLESKPYEPNTYYIQIINTLKIQIHKAIDRIQNYEKSTQAINPKRLLYIYNNIYSKQKQVNNLKAKLNIDAICYIQKILSDINIALETAVNNTIELNSILDSWGTDTGDRKNISYNRELIERVKNDEELLKISHTLGKYKEIIADKRKNSFSYGRGEKYDISQGNDINNCLSSELALLSDSATEFLFIRKFEKKQLKQYRKRTEIVKGKGDMIVLIDESGSMRDIQAWAKAFALALLNIASKDKRKFAMIHFASSNNVRTDIFEPGQYTSEDMLGSAEHFFGGGTNFETPLTEAIKLLEKGYEDADITIITDGECQISDDFAECFCQSKLKYKATVTGILLDKDKPCGKSLVHFCDSIYHSKNMDNNEIAIEILERNTL